MLDKQFVAQARMAFGDLPLAVIEHARLVEDVLGDDQLADVVQQGAAAQVVEVPLVHVELTGELDGPVGDALGVSLGLAPGGLEGARPALDGGVVRQGQLHVGALQVLEERGAVDGDAGGARQGGEELEPVIGGLQHGAVVDLENALHLSLGDERDGVVAGEVLTRQPGREERTDLLLI